MSSNSTSATFRFAPSPNGYLHLGHAYSALQIQQWAGTHYQDSAKFLLRIEDIDSPRCKPEFTQALMEDLNWLGVEFDEAPLFQSDRRHAYDLSLEKLQKLDLVYPCFCSRKEVAAKATSFDPDGAPIYPGTCRSLSAAERDAKIAAGQAHHWRLKTDEAVARTGPISFSVAQPAPHDRPQIRFANPLRWGDCVIARKDIGTSYHLSVTIDDNFQNITHVTRGRDMEAATDIHALLQFLLDLHHPIYTFHRLVKDEQGQKLAKSKASQSIRSLREAGISAKELRKELGFAPA